MPTPLPPSLLDELIHQDGVIWAAHIQPTRSEILALHADGSQSRNETVERVLSEAVLTAGDALGQRLGLGKAIETQQSHDGGGLFFRRFGENQILVVRHAPGVMLGRLRLCMSDVSVRLLAQQASTVALEPHPRPPTFGPATNFDPNTSPFAPLPQSAKNAAQEDSIVYKTSATA